MSEHQDPHAEIVIVDAGPFEAQCCRMPAPARRKEATLMTKIRDLVVKGHCADKRPAHKCCGAVTITRDAIVLQCPRCGDAKKIIGG